MPHQHVFTYNFIIHVWLILPFHAKLRLSISQFPRTHRTRIEKTEDRQHRIDRDRERGGERQRYTTNIDRGAGREVFEVEVF